MSRFHGAIGAAPDPWRSTSSGRMPRLFLCAVVAALVLLGLDVAFAVLLDPRPSRIGTTFVDTATELAAAAACFWTARRMRGAERRWRRLIGFAASGAMLTGLGTAAMLLATGSVGPPPVYAVLIPCYGLALAGLLSLPTDPLDGRGGSAETVRHGGLRWCAITMLDCLLLVGSIILLEWVTVLTALVHAGGHDPVHFLFSLVHAVAGLILATAVLLIASFRRPRSRGTLALLGTGLLTYGLTNNILVYHTAQGRISLPPWSLIGFALAWLLILLAALVPVPAHPQADGPTPVSQRVLWAHALLPYVVLGAVSLLVLGKLTTGTRLDRFETYGMLGLLLVTLVRQMVTLAENTRLLAAVREREQQLHYQAFHDQLTGLPNRALFARRLEQALAHNPDTDDVSVGTPLSVMFLDLDEFKGVNDAFGHAAGDELLKISAERLRAGTRAADTVARLGGDEFAVILDGGGPDNPRQIGERLAAAIQTPCVLAGRPYTPRASLGLVILDGSAAQPPGPDTLLNQADRAMYTAKRERAGRLVIYRPDLAPTGHHRTTRM
ncbi:diguanylate cyclase [Parafrankia sp. EAN1pec]|nr:diguanylate cyclase [Frankia sp. EAN1pec]